MSYQENGNCNCGCVTFHLELPEPITACAPRACDCDFCVARKACYLSHPFGEVTVSASETLAVEQQGSNQAKFLCCNRCGDLVAVICSINSELKGTINAPLLERFGELDDPLIVSPKKLSAKEKLARWDAAWMRVTINEPAS